MSADNKIRGAVNGYGVIRKRVVDAVHSQPDMHVVELVEVTMDWRCRLPETMDAIHALSGAVQKASESIAITSAALGMGAPYV